MGLCHGTSFLCVFNFSPVVTNESIVFLVRLLFVVIVRLAVAALKCPADGWGRKTPESWGDPSRDPLWALLQSRCIGTFVSFRVFGWVFAGWLVRVCVCVFVCLFVG